MEDGAMEVDITTKKLIMTLKLVGSMQLMLIFIVQMEVLNQSLLVGVYQNGFFMIKPGLWSGPWYFEDFPMARKENCSYDEEEPEDPTPQKEPTANRVVGHGTNKSLKISIGKKKLHSDEMKEMATEIYSGFVINGVEYCRRHLMIYCHLCRVNGQTLHEKVDRERIQLHLRNGGDPRINDRAYRWKDYSSEKQLQQQLQRDMLIYKYGKNHAKTHPEHWEKLWKEWDDDQLKINNRFLKENDEFMKNEGASQCCYWGCKTPNGIENKKLLKCTGCGIVKYCCPEHQKLDWKWEHRGECTSSIPDYIKCDIEHDREKNLNGDYSTNRGSFFE